MRKNKILFWFLGFLKNDYSMISFILNINCSFIECNCWIASKDWELWEGKPLWLSKTHKELSQFIFKLTLICWVGKEIDSLFRPEQNVHCKCAKKF